MRTVRNTKLAWLLVVAMLATMFISVPIASASAGYAALTKPAVSDEAWYELGTVILEANQEALAKDHVLIVNLPNDFKFYDVDEDDNCVNTGNNEWTIWDDVNTDNNVDAGETVWAKITAPQTVSGKDNALYNAGGTEFDVDQLDENQIKISINNNYAIAAGDDAAFLKFELQNIWVAEDFEGDITFTGDAASSSGFPAGTVIVGTAASGAITLSVLDKETSNDDFDVTVRVKENRAGALKKANDEALKFVLPDGYEWVGVDGGIAETAIWGEDLNLTADYEEDELTITLAAKSTEATCFELDLQFQVVDESKAENGDVVVDYKGDTSATPDELVMGNYGTFSVSLNADSTTPKVVAGFDDQEIADIVFEESIKESLVDGRYILLTLPSNARWISIDGADLDDDGDAVDEGLEPGDKIIGDGGCDLDFAGLQGTDNRTLKLKVDGASNSAAELTLEDIEVALQGGVTGDLVVEVSGNAGVSGEIVVAEVVKPIDVTVEKEDVKIGLMDQEAGNIVITENKAGAIKENVMKVVLPDGVEWDGEPDVEVTKGDLKIDDVDVDDEELEITIDRDSNTASEITISNIKYVIDRTVPAGDIEVKIKGLAVVETNDAIPCTDINTGEPYFETGTAATVVNATTVTPAPGETNQNAAFAIGNSEYTVNGVTQTMDVAPYIKDGRTYLPLRYVAQALGVAETNILWDDAAKAATLIKGDKVVQVKIGSNAMLINGISITMDVAPEITDGRTMLPFRFIGQAFGADFTWDDATKTVNMEL